MRYAFIEHHRTQYPVRLMCRLLDVSASGFYDWLSWRPSARDKRHAELLEMVKAAFEAARQAYGSPRITRELLAQGVNVCRNTVAKLMREAGLAGRRSRRYLPATTNSSHHYPIARNHLDRHFEPGGPPAWLADITYIPTAEGFLYLAAVMDLRSRRIVGWATATHMRAELAIEALHMALGRATAQEGLVHHSDRGVQYASWGYQDLLDHHGIVCSMSRIGDCYDNAVMESFWATLKVEEVYRQTYATRDQARLALFEYIEIFYNRLRRHSALGYKSPEAFEAGLN